MFRFMGRSLLKSLATFMPPMEHAIVAHVGSTTLHFASLGRVDSAPLGIAGMLNAMFFPAHNHAGSGEWNSIYMAKSKVLPIRFLATKSLDWHLLSA